MVASQRDRLGALIKSATLNGIDFVEIATPDELTLRIHFLNQVTLKGTVSRPSITGGETVKTVAVKPIDDTKAWSFDSEGRPILTLTVPTPGDFSFYTLALVSPKLDPFYDHTLFTFKAGCPSVLDCAPPGPDCPLPAGPAPAIDYLAKDFLSFRQALSDFSAIRYPRWRERSEADFGVMFMEALCAVADDLSYTQDRVAVEAALDTATERRSIVRLARLVDYEPMPAIAARTLLQLDVTGGPIPPGVVVSAPAPDGHAVLFETGTGLADTTNYVVDPAWNRPDLNAGTGLFAYFWDDSTRCLMRGSSEMWVSGWGHGFIEGIALLIETEGEPGDPPLRQVVHLTPSKPGLSDHAVEELDQLFNQQVTHIRWGAAEALAADRDLNRTTLAGNLVPATQGRRYDELFAIECPPDDPNCLPLAYADLPHALISLGPNSTPEFPVPIHLYTLRSGRLAWMIGDELDAQPMPEIALIQVATSPGQVDVTWPWVRRLLDADPYEPAFTIDVAAFQHIARNSDQSSSADYAGDAADSARFGDGVFGPIPDGGTVFRVRYRVADGVAGNVAADAISGIESPSSIVRVSNPFPSTGGSDPEPAERVRRLAPQAFRARQYRAVRPSDYEAAAERLPWVLTAGTRFRWTGSWLTIFTTADPAGREGLPPEPRTELVDLLNRYRLAGYESYVPEPHYVSLDLIVTVCANPDAFVGDVESELLTRLGTGRLIDGTPAFFYFDQFTFGTPLERSRMEAAIQAAPGVAGVLSIQVRRRGVTYNYQELSEKPLEVAPDEILRVDNDPSRPGMGSLRVYVEGGK
jgi:hypothetical protein